GGAFKAQVFYKFHHEHGGRADRIFVLSEKTEHKISNRQFKPIDSVLIIELRLYKKYKLSCLETFSTFYLFDILDFLRNWLSFCIKVFLQALENDKQYRHYKNSE